jgi:hypothetical protein
VDQANTRVIYAPAPKTRVYHILLEIASGWVGFVGSKMCNVKQYGFLHEQRAEEA